MTMDYFILLMQMNVTNLAIQSYDKGVHPNTVRSINLAQFAS